MKFLKILFILLLIVFPLGELLRFDFGNSIRSKPLDIIAIAITFYWFFLFLFKKIKFQNVPWYLFLFPAVALISLLFNSQWLKLNEFFASALYLIRWVSYFGVFFVVTQFDSSFKKKIIWLMIFDGLLIVILGYMQYFFFSDLKPLYYLGWDDHMYRMFSVFLDPNYTGAFFALLLIFCLGHIFKYSQDHKINFVTIFNNKKVQKKTVIIGLTIIAFATLIALLLTFSRSSLLMLIVSMSVFFVLIGRKKLIFLLLAAIVFFIMIISSKFNVENINLFRQASTNARIGNYQIASEIISQHPIVGVGFNTYRYAKANYNVQMGWTNAPSHADAGVDNSFLFILATTGIVGLISYVILWGYILRNAFILYRTKTDVYAIILIASVVGLFVHAMFINSLFFPAIMVWVWIVVGLMERKLH